MQLGALGRSDSCCVTPGPEGHGSYRDCKASVMPPNARGVAVSCPNLFPATCLLQDLGEGHSPRSESHPYHL